MVVVDRKPLGQLLRRPPRYGINAAAVPLAPRLPTYIRITDIDDSGRFAPEPKVGVAHPDSGKYLLKAGDLVFARTGASVGKSYLYNPRDGKLVYAGFLINISPDPAKLNPKYLALFAQTKEYWDWIARTSARSGQPGVNGREYAQLPVPLPDTATQDVIADVITDVESTIDALERVIAKKQAMKRGMMQQLLSGKTRLPGFHTQWRMGAVEQLAVPARERVMPATLDPSTLLVELEQIEPGTGRLVQRSSASDAVSMKTAFRCGDVLFGKLRAYLRKYWLADSGGVCTTEIWALRPKAGVNDLFLRYVVETDGFIDVATGAYGTHMPRSDWNAVRRMELLIPPTNEQRAIGQALFDADTEIELLNARLTKAKAIKQGMLQQLLTGRVRLPAKEAVA